MLGLSLPDIDITKLFDTSTRTGRIVELVIYTLIAAIVTTIVLLIYNRFVKRKLKDNIQKLLIQVILK